MMKKLLTLFSACFMAMTSVQAQCDLDFSFTNTGTNMTAFFTPPAASAIYAELGDGTLGAFFINSDGEYVCGTSVAFTGSQVQLAVMADDSTTPEKDGFSSGESFNWFYQTIDGVYSVSVSPDDSFAINAISFISSASVEAVDCGGGAPTGDECPPLDFEVLNTGSNMTLFVINGSLLSDLGNGTVGVYFIDDNGLEVCGGSQSFSGGQVQIAAMGDDATSTEKDGFSAGEAIVWKFESNDGSQYDLTPSPQDVFTLNATSFVIGMTNDAISCAVDLEGCTDDTYVEYNPQASIDDGSCATVAILGCTDSNYVEYDANANVDDGSCVTVSLDGCTDASACNYNSDATTDDGSCYNNDLGCGCDTPAADEGYDCAGNCLNDADGDQVCDEDEVVGCQDPLADNYDSSATDAGDCEYAGCTNDLYIEYNPYATIDDGSCTTLIVEGCTDSNATNYDSSANTSDGSCEYDLISAGCSVSFIPVENSGNNHTVFLTPGAVEGTPISSGDDIGVFYISDDGSAQCAGSSVWNGDQLQITVFGDDATTDEIDGFTSGAPLLLLAQSGDDVYVVSASYQMPSMSTFTVNGISFVMGLDFELACTVEYLGCTDASACNYDSTANTDDGSCYNNDLGCGCDTPAADDGYDCDGNCLNDADGDQVCDEDEVVGCQDPLADNYDSSATDAGDCEYAGCTDSNYLEFNSDATIDDGSCTTLIVEGCTDSNATNYDSSANTNDGSCEYDLIGAGCSVNFEATNTGNSHTLFLTPGAVEGTPLSSGDDIGVFYILEDGSAQCAGYSTWTGDQLQITVFGDDGTTEEVDGFTTGLPLLLLAQSGDDVYIVSASYQMPSMSTFFVNGLSFVVGLEFDLACTVEHLGCTDASACNYDSTANTDDGSCYNNDLGCGCDTPAADEGYNCDGNCLNDSDDDGICDEDEVVGCQDPSAANYDSSATDAGDCTSWEEAYEDCLSSGGDDGITQADVDAAFDNGVSSVDITSDNQDIADDAYNIGYNEGAASVIPEDGVTQNNLDEMSFMYDSILNNLQSELDQALNNINNGIEPIFIDILEGWNMIGYTLSEPQDVVATLQEIVDVILIMKNNYAEVYWPEYGFNGIGDFIPGQGYQIKVTEAYLGFTYPDVSGQRIELVPTVPQWAIDMEIAIHPNDIRTLVRVVNMLGQEVNPENQASGTVLLYLYNDATVEKKIK
jgi:hypothetical protein